ncbi:hypothetical protein IB237_23350 [Agrobacterium sp. AGB01]|uniref:hypothetical protein n=1 Tax=Agrobacterium sp. AGB01 TaxID=2769302 RepID=UPI001782A9EA|nr:hypothetical protein [Agrobacterium sp. AGB01]MBD9390141.1 hypothetical protein [Agrobacterium sp. AGB01]
MTDQENLVMASATQIAERDNVTKQAVSKAIRKLIDERPDTPVERGQQGQIIRISLAHYDHFRQSFTNPAKAVAPLRSEDGRPTGRGSSTPIRVEDSFEEARRQSEWLKVGRERIRHQEDCGQLIRKDKNEQALTVIGVEIQSILKRLPNRSDDIAMAVSKEGVHGVRVLMRQIAFDVGVEIADKLSAIAAAAPEQDPLIEDEDA